MKVKQKDVVTEKKILGIRNILIFMFFNVFLEGIYVLISFYYKQLLSIIWNYVHLLGTF